MVCGYRASVIWYPITSVCEPLDQSDLYRLTHYRVLL